MKKTTIKNKARKKISPNNSKPKNASKTDYTSPLLHNVKKNDYYKEHSKAMREMVYWISCLIMIVLNVFVAFAMVPILLVMTGFSLYLILAVLGTLVGIIFGHLIGNIEMLEKKHHIFAAILIPFLAVLNIVLISNLTNKIITLFSLNSNTNNPVILSIYFTVFLILPYIIKIIKK